MDKINLLSDDLLLQILSLVPTKDVIMAASCVSKRWWSLCSLVTRLEYDDSNYYNSDSADYKSFTQFVYRTLMSNKAPALEKLHLNLGPKCHAVDVGIWIDIAVSHRVRELKVKIRLESGSPPVSLPSSLFTCETLENLTLIHCLVSDVPCCLPFLKSLRLEYVSNASLPKLLQGSPNLQSLRMLVENKEHGEEDITIALPRLQYLYFWDAREKMKSGVYVIEAPRLE
ncbi:F-box/FBD/LRR-repeat protein [Cardamine amara subsp. amara]|uniref:F-box/FBD/LRR-repeat protein n=1 Tax=Cardamine amara subsp. amara TaxID=228776 RepID=A0ABD1AKF0_CARAN